MLEKSAAEYRADARRVRELAARIGCTMSNLALLETAHIYDRLAERAEEAARRESIGSA